MKTAGSFLSLMLVVALVGCGAEIHADDPNNGGDNNNDDTGTSECPPPGKWKCVGHGPDKGMVCTCEGLWDCSKDPNKCDGGRPVPPGGGSR